MFIHNFKYTFITLLKNKALIFWSFAFPLILGTLFNLTFSNIVNSEKLSIIDIAIVDNEEFKNNLLYVNTFNELSKGDNQIFNIKYIEENKAKDLLDDDKISGYLKLENKEPKLYFNKNGINQTIFKYVVEEINSESLIVNNIMEHEIINGNINIDYSKIYEYVSNMLNKEINIHDISSKNMNFMMIEFYTLIAFVCLYGGIIGMTAINFTLANMGSIGKRIETSPTKKSTIVLSSLLSSYLIQLIGLFILYMYTIFVLKVDYGNHLTQVIILSLIGSLTGLSLGLCLGACVRKSEGVKLGILLAITMIGSFLSGMMGVTLKYVIDKNIPYINLINPANMITDGLYSLYYYQTLNRYYFNLGSLLIVSFILIILSIISLRRKKYDSI